MALAVTKNGINILVKQEHCQPATNKNPSFGLEILDYKHQVN
jgi:hypothetical protein